MRVVKVLSRGEEVQGRTDQSPCQRGLLAPGRGMMRLVGVRDVESSFVAGVDGWGRRRMGL